MTLAVATPISAEVDTALNVAENVAFGIIAALMIFAALRVVTTKNVVHAALWLVLVLAGVAAQYILLAAEFVAITQVLVYIGAIVVLFLFGVMLTRAPMGEDTTLTRKNWYGGAFVAVMLFGLLSFSVIDTWDDTRLPDERQTGLPRRWPPTPPRRRPRPPSTTPPWARTRLRSPTRSSPST